MFDINNRRYLGSKFKLLGFIDEVIGMHCKASTTLTDLFGGTGVVAYHFNNRYDVKVNDTLLANYVSYLTFFDNELINHEKLRQYIEYYNQLPILNKENYYSKNFADTFLSRENMWKVGDIRDDIDFQFKEKSINARERAILITSLIYAIDKIANTVGHYDAYRRNGELDKILLLKFPNIDDKHNKDNEIYNLDANQLVKQIQSDIVYIDPPYNSRQYCDAYHFIENVANNSKPEVLGVARKMDRAHLKSAYCTNKATTQFRQLIDDITAKYIIVSYNNTGEKINSRSNAKISDTEIFEILSSKGEVFTYEKSFNAFTTGKTNVLEHKERLFVCEVHVRDSDGTNQKNKAKTISESISRSLFEDQEIIQSPLNYTGGKFRLMPQINARLPDNIGVFYDIFSGGANVGINVNAERVYCIEKNSHVVSLIKFLQKSQHLELEKEIEAKIASYGLSDSFTNSYEFYNCNSSNGLGSFNKPPFLKLREDFNREHDDLSFLLLIMFSFNNQIRFNAKNEFNLPVGKRDFNSSLRKKLRFFIERIRQMDITFRCLDFRELDINTLAKEKAFLYLDPPYYLGTASYNENGGWTESDEEELLHFLTRAHQKGVRFALSNVIKHKERTHEDLVKWCLDHAFNTNHLSYSYANSSYQAKNKDAETQEVLITNY